MNRGFETERRRHVRVVLSAVARVHWPDGVANFHTLNVSAGGVFLLTEKLPEAEQEMELELFLPQVKAPVKAKGEVVWFRRQEPTGFAVMFTEISQAASELIRLVVQRMQQRKG